MNLDDLSAFAELDSKNIYAHLDSFPEQVESAWRLGQAGELPAGQNARQVIMAGMGTSAVGAELAAEYLLMAALLMEIKSRMLLPPPEVDDEAEEGGGGAVAGDGEGDVDVDGVLGATEADSAAPALAEGLEALGSDHGQPPSFTRKFLNCHGSEVSTSSGNNRPRSLSGVQSPYLPTTGPR